MDYSFELKYTYKMLKKDPELRQRIKEISGNPNATNYMEKGDNLVLQWGFNIVADAQYLKRNLAFFYKKDKKQFADLPTEMLRDQVDKMRDYCDVLDNFITKVERER